MIELKSSYHYLMRDLGNKCPKCELGFFSLNPSSSRQPSLQILRSHSWASSLLWNPHHLRPFQTNAAKIITAKFKNLRVIKAWQGQLFSLKANITNVKLILSLLCILEEFRNLTLHEWNFRFILKQKLLSLLRQQKIYLKQRGSIRWVTKGDAGTKFFHANATIRHRKNLITCLEDSLGVIHSVHQLS